MLHVQEPVNDWLQAVERIPAGSLVKAFSVQWLSEAKAKNPAVNTMLRYVHDELQDVNPDDTEQVRENRARDWFGRFIDGTFLDGSTAGIPHWQATDMIGWWNEFYADSQSPEEKALFWKQERTAARIWQQEYRQGPHAAKLGHIRLAICATAIGNTIPIQSAETAVLYDCVLDYHAYTYWEMIDGEPTRAANDWADLSGRWEGMDNDFRAAGYTCDWLFGESGPFTSTLTGWRHEGVLGGHIPYYVEAVRQFVRDVKDTHAYATGRVLGFALFTTVGGNHWTYYQTRQPELNELANMLRQEWTPVTPPPVEPPPTPAPLPPAVIAQLWQLSDNYPHKINYSPNLGLWQAILADGRSPVHTELSTTIDNQPYAVQAAFKQGEEDELHVWTPGLPLLVLARPSAPPLPHVDRPLGVDVSHWNSPVNWQTAKSQGFWFAFAKSSERDNWVDPAYTTNWQGTKAAGILRGAYHFYRNAPDPIAQAEWFYNTVKATGDLGELPPVLDVEVEGNTGDFGERVKACLLRIFQLFGRKPLIYSSPYYMNKYLRVITPAQASLWIANWTQNQNPTLPTGWSEYEFWQFTSDGDGHKYGAQSERLDLNRYPGTLQGLYDEYATG
jgi:GH25 family lysozyme M1 (1,4-beta-N-acetylmuramidase)